MCAIPRQPPIGRKTSRVAPARCGSRRVTQRGNMFDTGDTIANHLGQAQQRSENVEGSKPATTTGTLCLATKGSKMPEPVIVAACPAARKPALASPACR